MMFISCSFIRLRPQCGCYETSQKIHTCMHRENKNRNTIMKRFKYMSAYAWHMVFVNALRLSSAVTSAGRAFHARAARYANVRWVADKRHLLRCRCPAAVARVSLSDTLARLTKRDLRDCGLSLSVKAPNTLRQSRRRTISPMSGHPSDFRAGDMCSLRRTPVTSRAAKLMTFCTRDR